MQHQFLRSHLAADGDHLGQEFEVGHTGAVVQHRNVQFAGEREMARPDLQTGLVGHAFGVQRLLTDFSHGPAAADTDFDILHAGLRGGGHLLGTHAAGRTADPEALGRQVRGAHQCRRRKQDSFHRFR